MKTKYSQPRSFHRFEIGIVMLISPNFQRPKAVNRNGKRRNEPGAHGRWHMV